MSRQRVKYSERELLQSTDLCDEQAYRIQMRRRHNLAHHGWGIVDGLGIEVDRLGNLSIAPGYAVDVYGRELVVSQALIIRRSVIEAMVSEINVIALDIYLSYHLEQSSEASSCPSRARQSHASQSQDQEQAWVRLECGSLSDAVNPNQPAGLIAVDDPDEGDEWPVYLGRVQIIMSSEGAQIVQIPAKLRYAHVVSAAVLAPWANSNEPPWMRVSNEESAGDIRFAVNLANKAGKSQDRLSLDRSGNTEFFGKVNVKRAGVAGLSADGDIGTLGSALENSDMPTGVAFASLDEPSSAKPWYSYRTTSKGVDQLRIEIANPGEEGDPSRKEWNIGFTELGGEVFSDLLSARADGTVIVNGGLVVKGQLTQGPIPADMDNSRFRDELLSRYTKGLTLAGSEVEAFYKLDIEVTPTFQDEATQQALLGARITITNNNVGSRARAVQIASVEFEVRDQQQSIIHRNLMEPPPNNPLPPVNASTYLDAAFPLAVPGIYTFIARVNTVGGSQSVLEQSSSRVVTILAP